MSTQAQQESLLTQFFNKSEEYIALFNKLQADAPSVKGTALEPELKAILDAGESTRSKIDGVKTMLDNTIDFVGTSWGNISDWAKDAIGLGAAQMSGTGLGIIPFLIPAAAVSAIGGAVYTLNHWIDNAQKVSQRIDLVNDYKKQGYNDSEAIALTNNLLAEKAKRGVLDKMLMI